MLDCGILYLRHNLQRKLKIETHLVCLRLIHELLFCLQSHQVRLDAFEWRELWRALFSLASRVGSRIDELKNVQDIDRLAQQVRFFSSLYTPTHCLHNEFCPKMIILLSYMHQKKKKKNHTAP
jgi:hypothetical protein